MYLCGDLDSKHCIVVHAQLDDQQILVSGVYISLDLKSAWGSFLPGTGVCTANLSIVVIACTKIKK